MADSNSKSVVSMAIVGCGAISQLFHMPILGGHPGFQITALVDKNTGAAKKLAEQYGIHCVVDDVTKLPFDKIDAGLIATPPSVHCPAAEVLLRQGKSVFIEKPMALRSAEAESVCQVASQSQGVAAVGYFRRLFPALEVVRQALKTQRFGQLREFEVSEGCFFDWPSLTMGSMKKSTAGGGVLIDTGSHVIDQLLSLFDEDRFEILEFQSDAWGEDAIEADAQVRLRLYSNGQPVEGTVHLSRIAALPSQFVLKTEQGELRWKTTERNDVRFIPAGSAGTQDPISQVLNLTGQNSPDILAAFRAEWDDFYRAATGQTFVLSAQSALPTVKLIEQCYQIKESGDPRYKTETPFWMSERLQPAEQRVNPNGIQTVLVTGATGFIGCRMVEMLSRRGYKVRAMVHSAAKASRLVRLDNVEIVQANLLKPATLEKAVDGVDAVIHCAYGTALERKAALAATVKGSQNIAKIARAHAVKRFIYCSTLAVNGTREQNAFTPKSPLTPDAYDYAISKAKAERLVQREINAGLKGVIFRLGNVYGPFSAPWTIRIFNQLKSGFPVLYQDGETVSNLIYVDNVVEIADAVLCGSEQAVGQKFVLSDAQQTWKAVYGAFAQAAGKIPASVTDKQLKGLKKAARKTWFNLPLRSMQCCKDLLTGESCKRFLISCLTSDPLGNIPRWVFYSCPGVRPAIRCLLGLNRPDLYYGSSEGEAPQPTTEDVNLFDIYACPAVADTSALKDLLNYTQVVSNEEALARTIRWAQESGLTSQE